MKKIVNGVLCGAMALVIIGACGFSVHNTMANLDAHESYTDQAVDAVKKDVHELEEMVIDLYETNPELFENG